MFAVWVQMSFCQSEWVFSQQQETQCFKKNDKLTFINEKPHWECSNLIYVKKSCLTCYHHYTLFNATSRVRPGSDMLMLMVTLNLLPTHFLYSLFISKLRCGGRTQAASSWKWLLPPAPTETGENYLWQTSYQNHPSLWVRLNSADLASESSVRTLRLHIDSKFQFSLLMLRKKGTYSCPQPSAWPITQHIQSREG